MAGNKARIPELLWGHEFTGIVEETGSEVKKFKKGSRVLSPFTTSCGECFYCRIGLTCRCEKGKLYGWVEKGHGLEGAQAEYIRVPMADSTLFLISNDLTEKKALLLGDVFSTGYFCADNAGIKPGGNYIVVGCGPVGLMTVVAAKHLGAEKLLPTNSNYHRVPTHTRSLIRNSMVVSKQSWLIHRKIGILRGG